MCLLDLPHVLPVGEDAILSGMLEGQDVMLSLGLLLAFSSISMIEEHRAWERSVSSTTKPALHVSEPLSILALPETVI